MISILLLVLRVVVGCVFLVKQMDDVCSFRENKITASPKPFDPFDWLVIFDFLNINGICSVPGGNYFNARFHILHITYWFWYDVGTILYCAVRYAIYGSPFHGNQNSFG